MLDTYRANQVGQAARMFKAQPPCNNSDCGEQGYLRYDPDTDEYLICDICGTEQ